MRTARDQVEEYRRQGHSDIRIRELANHLLSPLREEVLSLLVTDEVGAPGTLPAGMEDFVIGDEKPESVFCVIFEPFPEEAAAPASAEVAAAVSPPEAVEPFPTEADAEPSGEAETAEAVAAESTPAAASPDTIEEDTVRDGVPPSEVVGAADATALSEAPQPVLLSEIPSSSESAPEIRSALETPCGIETDAPEAAVHAGSDEDGLVDAELGWTDDSDLVPMDDENSQVVAIRPPWSVATNPESFNSDSSRLASDYDPRLSGQIVSFHDAVMGRYQAFADAKLAEADRLAADDLSDEAREESRAPEVPEAADAVTPSAPEAEAGDGIIRIASQVEWRSLLGENRSEPVRRYARDHRVDDWRDRMGEIIRRAEENSEAVSGVEGESDLGFGFDPAAVAALAAVASAACAATVEDVPEVSPEASAPSVEAVTEALEIPPVAEAEAPVAEIPIPAGDTLILPSEAKTLLRPHSRRPGGKTAVTQVSLENDTTSWIHTAPEANADAAEAAALPLARARFEKEIAELREWLDDIGHSLGDKEQERAELASLLSARDETLKLQNDELHRLRAEIDRQREAIDEVHEERREHAKVVEERDRYRGLHDELARVVPTLEESNRNLSRERDQLEHRQGVFKTRYKRVRNRMVVGYAAAAAALALGIGVAFFTWSRDGETNELRRKVGRLEQDRSSLVASMESSRREADQNLQRVNVLARNLEDAHGNLKAAERKINLMGQQATLDHSKMSELSEVIEKLRATGTEQSPREMLVQAPALPSPGTPLVTPLPAPQLSVGSSDVANTFPTHAEVLPSEDVAHVLYRTRGTDDPKLVEWIIKENKLGRNAKGQPRLKAGQVLILPPVSGQANATGAR